MILKTYKEYKDSCVQYLGMVPEHWERKRAKYLFYEVDERSTIGNEELLSVSHITGVTPRSQKNVTMFKSESYVGSKICRTDDLVINTMWAWMAALGISKYTGIVSPSYNVYRLICEKAINTSFFDKLLRTSFYKYLYHINSVGVRSSRLRLYPDRFYSIPFYIPSPSEQAQIAKFLDWKTVQIARFIKAKKRMIELLKEQKQVIINDAVTGKIDVTTGKPYPKYKDSEVEWLGKVPDEWKLRRLKFTVKGKLQYGANSSGIEYRDDLPRYIRITDFNKNGTLDESKKLSLSIESALGYYLNEDDILFARSGATVGKAFQCKNLKQKSCFAGYLIKAEPDISIVLSDYLYLYTQSFIFEKWRNFTFIKATIENIGADKYSQLLILLPNKEQQCHIVNYVEDRTSVLDIVISRTEREISLMLEYRDRLIADAVTGKVDVREIEVPDIVQEAESDDTDIIEEELEESAEKENTETET